MYWADKLVREIEKKYAEKIKSGKEIIIRDEKTASGRIHVGSLRGVAIHGIVSEILGEKGIKNKYLFEINDFDPMDGLPGYLDKKKYQEHMGKPLCNVPSPDEKAKNYAEYFAGEFVDVIKEIGFEPEYYRLSDDYRAGKFNDVIKTVLENADEIRKIYKEVSGSVKDDNWMPLSVICEKCGKIGTTKVTSFDGEKVRYSCEENIVKWAKGCSHEGEVSPFDGNAKLPWKVEWAAKFKVYGVDVEGAGKDHSTAGGSRDISDNISRKILEHEPPFNIPYEFFNVGGKKMSSSKGFGASSREMSDLLPPEMLRLLLLGKDYKKTIDFIPDGDTVPILYDTYDKMAGEYFRDSESDQKRVFSLIHTPSQRRSITERFLPRFSQITFLVQMPHMDNYEIVEEMKESPLSNEDKKEVDRRAKYAKGWLKKFAPENYKYELQEEKIPEAAKNFSEEQKKALLLVLEYVKSQENLDGQDLHTKFHDIKDEIGINPRDLFSAIYISFLNKESGPKAGWFLSVLDKDFLEKRLEEVSK